MDISAALLKSLGVNPDELKESLANAGAEYKAFKTGFRNAMTHFDCRLKAIEENQAEILRLLRSQDITVPVIQRENGWLEK